ncbi:MAG: ABC transporter ATP-binding protein [Acidobacteria bacterium]|nr:ABC transporter ATP-binding protein [Acidobacteriota bacterium]
MTTAGTPGPALRIDGLRKSYRSPDGEVTPVLHIPAFTLGRGEQIALRGSSGSGKTTLLHIVAGILQADAGRVWILDRDITSLAEPARDRLRAECIGYVFQTFNLLPAYSALENVMLGMMFGPGADADAATALLRRVGLGDRLRYRPRQLSVGQQQRVAVARALANRPALVLADEPTGNLDARHAREALTLIRDMCREAGAALLLVSHDPAVLDQFDRVDDLAHINLAATDGIGASGAVTHA